MIRMILTDLDHTLLKQDGSISGETLRVIEECRGKGNSFCHRYSRILDRCRTVYRSAEAGL